MHVISGLLFPLPIGFDIIIRSFGLAIFVSGVYIAIWAKYTMGLSWSHPLDHVFESNHRLVTHGPFAYSRNPIYLSVILMNFGTVIALKSAFIFLVFVQYNQMLMTILQEEEHLLTRYGKQFESYMQKVSRFI
jgi:protein-S-isoprenylcysteine O-methyltransferase Ste14